MPVPNTFANATATIPLSQLDANFATTITLGNTAIQLGNTVSTLNNMTLANVTVTSGNVTITNVTVTTANVTTANIATAEIANVTVSGTGTFAAGSNTAPSITTSGDTNTGIFFPTADTIAFTEGGAEVARFDSAGNFGVGTTTPVAKNHIKGTGTSGQVTASWILENGSSGTGGMDITGAAGASRWRFLYGGGPSTGTNALTEAMCLLTEGASAGNVGIGTSSPNRKLVVDGGSSDAYFKLTTSATASNFASGILFNNTLNSDGNIYIRVNGGESNLLFGTGGSERARIGASGGLAIVNGLAVGTSTVFTSSIFFASAVLSAGAGSFPLRWNSSTGIVTYDTSSRFVKENIEDSPYGLAEVMQLQPRKYFRVDDQKFEIGFVADEIQPILPEFVPIIQKSTFTKNEEDIEAIAGGVNYEKLTAVLVKAIQELNAKVDAQAAEIAALKGNA